MLGKKALEGIAAYKYKAYVACYCSLCVCTMNHMLVAVLTCALCV